MATRPESLRASQLVFLPDDESGRTPRPSGSTHSHSRTPVHTPILHTIFPASLLVPLPSSHPHVSRLPAWSLTPSPEGTLNAAYNCLDRHFYANPDKTAIIYEADESSESREISFKELMKETCKIANVLKSWGVKKGDAVSI